MAEEPWHGGEEYLVVLNRCEPASAPARADDLRMSISGRPIATRREPLKVTISVRLALSCDFPGGGADDIIPAADAALYAAKAGGRNCVRVADLGLARTLWTSRQEK